MVLQNTIGFVDVSVIIFKQLTKMFLQYKDLWRSLELQRTNHSYRANCNRQKQATQKLAKETVSFLKQLPHLYGELPSEIRPRKIQVEKLRENFTAALNSFQKVQRVAAEKERESVSRARSVSSSMPFPSGTGGYGDEHNLAENNRTAGGIQIQGEEEISVELIEERERAIRQLEADIVGVNEIFRDLATMVHEQGDMIDSIEANVDSAAVHVEDGNVQLQKASDYQKSARKKMCCILVIVVIAAAILGVIIYVATK
ncbi:syntaxin-7-like isoform X1 [Acropora millepora]|uniref:syntaxin-7-like isoform X1 n=1 Tax=Acropora millepora TaxID=45264 RepID=UPI001CF114F1|nr:syntaxin-7-like isoform X1 [Acropora millepora]